jgi:hypothetical protein
LQALVHDRRLRLVAGHDVELARVAVTHGAVLGEVHVAVADRLLVLGERRDDGLPVRAELLLRHAREFGHRHLVGVAVLLEDELAAELGAAVGAGHRSARLVQIGERETNVFQKDCCHFQIAFCG